MGSFLVQLFSVCCCQLAHWLPIQELSVAMWNHSQQTPRLCTLTLGIPYNHHTTHSFWLSHQQDTKNHEKSTWYHIQQWEPIMTLNYGLEVIMSATSNKLASVAPIQQGGPTMTLNYTLEVIMSAPTNKLASVALTCLESGRATLLETVDPRHRKMALH